MFALCIFIGVKCKERCSTICSVEHVQHYWVQRIWIWNDNFGETVGKLSVEDDSDEVVAGIFFQRDRKKSLKRLIIFS